MKPIKVTVLAFDPGGSSGIAYFRAVYAKGEYLFTEYGCETLGPEEHHRSLWEYLEKEYHNADFIHLVTESFEFRNDARVGLNMISREYIGIIRLFFELQNNSKAFPSKKIVYEKQSPAQAKTFVGNNNLRKMKIFKPGKEFTHEMDAYRHLFWYLIHRAKIMPDKFLAAGWK